jgi:hypothetical protein
MYYGGEYRLGGYFGWLPRTSLNECALPVANRSPPKRSAKASASRLEKQNTTKSLSSWRPMVATSLRDHEYPRHDPYPENDEKAHGLGGREG